MNEKQKQTTSAFTEVILESISDGVFTVDHHWRITSFNKAAEQITGVLREKALGRYCWEVFRSNMCEGDCALKRTMNDGKSFVSSSTSIINSEKKSIPISVSTSRVASGSGLVTQYDKGDVEDAGLVKFDFLGLRTLTIIDWAVKMINPAREREGELPLDIMQIPLQDKASFDLLQSAETTAVFQLESRGMKDLVKRLQPDCFEDIVALVALYRPGPLGSGMVDDFIDRKDGRAPVKYAHPQLESILQPTYGVILYQEQVMATARVVANYSLGEGDLLRRAMGKKIAEEMAKQRARFLEGECLGDDLAGRIHVLALHF